MNDHHTLRAGREESAVSSHLHPHRGALAYEHVIETSGQ